MSDLRFQPLTNVRPSREQGTHLIVNTTRGSLKLTPKAAKAVGLRDKDHCALAKAGDRVFILEGYEDLEGSKLASSKQGGAGDLNFSSSMAWETLGGNDSTKRYYTVSETPLADEEVAGTIFEGKKLFEVIFEKEEEKQQRKAKEDKVEDVTEEAPVAEAVVAGTESTETSDFENSDFSDL
jgi:hypothetical protein